MPPACHTYSSTPGRRRSSPTGLREVALDSGAYALFKASRTLLDEETRRRVWALRAWAFQVTMI
jgi:hypothetical protein